METTRPPGCDTATDSITASSIQLLFNVLRTDVKLIIALIIITDQSWDTSAQLAGFSSFKIQRLKSNVLIFPVML